MYTEIKDMMSAEEAADQLVRISSNIRTRIREHDNCFFHRRAESIKALLSLLEQYVANDAMNK